MATRRLNLKISLDTGDDTSPQVLARLTRRLYQDIAKLGVDSVERAADEQPGEIVKGSPMDISTLLVTLSSASVLVALIQLLQAWVLRAEGRKVKIRVEDKAIELEYSPTAASKDELMAFAEELQQLLEKKQQSI